MANYSDLFQGHGFIYKDDPENLHTNKYEQAFHNFPSAGTAEEVSKAVKNLLNKHEKENFTAEVLKQIHGFIDLTSLTSIDTKESIWKLVDRVNDFEGIRLDVPNVAAICTYPLFIETVKQALTAQEVKIASVAGGFPSSQTFMEIKIAETGMAVMQGADEIDMVINVGRLKDKQYDYIVDEVSKIKMACQGRILKVILETDLLTKEEIKKACELCVEGKADFVKTSSGFVKNGIGATVENIRLMSETVSGAGLKVKASGGIRDRESALKMIEAGAARLGTSSGVKLCSGT